MAQDRPPGYPSSVSMQDVHIRADTVQSGSQVFGAQINHYHGPKDHANETIEQMEEVTTRNIEQRHPQGLVWTRAMATCKRALEVSNVCIISGKDGAGKTATAHAVLDNFKQTHRVVQVHDLEQLKRLTYLLVKESPEEKAVIFYDDLFRSCNTVFETRKDFGTWESAFAPLRAHLGRIRLVFTRNDETCLLENKQKMFLQSNFAYAASIDLHSSDNKLTDREKVSIFRKFLVNQNWRADTRIGVVVAACKKIGAYEFPEACRIFASKSQVSFADFLRPKFVVANGVIDGLALPRSIDNLRALKNPDRDPSVDLEGNTTVHFAVVEKSIASLREYFEESRAMKELDQQNELGQTPLHLALLNNFTEGVDFLLDHRARVDIQDKGGNLPLHLAVQHCNSDIVLRLVNAGPRQLVNLQNSSGYSPLQLAEQEGSMDKIRILWDAAAEMDEDEDYSWQTSPEQSGQQQDEEDKGFLSGLRLLGTEVIEPAASHVLSRVNLPETLTDNPVTRAVSRGGSEVASFLGGLFD